MDPVLSGNWNFPTRILHGPGRVAELGMACQSAEILHPLIVTDAGLRGSAIISEVEHALRASDLDAPVFFDVKSNPTGKRLPTRAQVSIRSALSALVPQYSSGASMSELYWAGISGTWPRT